MTSGEGTPSSEEMIRRAREEMSRPPPEVPVSPPSDGSEATPEDEDHTQGQTSLVEPSPVPDLSDLPSPPAPPPPPPPTRTVLSPRRFDAPSPVDVRRPRRGSRFALAASVPLFVFGLLTLAVLAGGVVSGDDEVTGNIAGFVILLVATLVPAVLLLRRYLRPRR